MTKEFETMLRLFGDCALGRKSNLNDINNIDGIIAASHNQGIWTCVYPQLFDVAGSAKYRMSFLALISKSVRQNEFTMNVLSEVEAQGMKYCILKGIFASSLYANPDYRISGDIDILINPKDEKKFAEFLKSKGYEVEKRKKNDHHLAAIHPVGGILEVHVRLYGHVTDEVIFGKKISYGEPPMKVKSGKREFYTLGITDNLYFLTAHYIKHFVAGESGVRQMMDLLLFMKKYESEIDFEKYNSWLKELRYDRLINAVRSIGSKYFGMDFELCDEKYMNAVLDDCEKCGLFAQAADEGVYFYRQYCHKRKAVSEFRLKWLFWFKHETTLADRIFVPQEKLVNSGYSYAKHKVMLPVAWLHKLVDHALKKNRTPSGKPANGEYLGKREKMMKELDLFD